MGSTEKTSADDNEIREAGSGFSIAGIQLCAANENRRAITGKAEKLKRVDEPIQMIGRDAVYR